MPYRIQGFQASMCKVGTGLCYGAYPSIGGEDTMKAVTWIGVDIAKDSCVVAQRCPEGFQTEEFPITPQGLKALGNWFAPAAPASNRARSHRTLLASLHQWVQLRGTGDPDRRGEPPTGERFC